MIEIERFDLPASHALEKKGTRETKAMVAKWRADPSNFKPKIDDNLYKKAKDALFSMQHGKCCYCESTMKATSYGPVEHYRPKKGVTEAPSHRGYWWLAYDWHNLLLSCAVCNTSHKQNYFPLKDESKRALDPDDVIEDEAPLLLDPCRVDPQEHITFRAEVIAGTTPEGIATVERLGLNRDEVYIHPETEEVLETGLLRRRRRHLQRVSNLYGTLRFLTEKIDEGKLEKDDFWQKKWSELRSYLLDPTEEYCAMSRAAFLNNFELVLE